MPASRITVTFDGLFLLRQKDNSCEIKICTAAAGHRMEIVVFKDGGPVRYPSSDPTEFFTIKNLQTFGSLSFEILDAGGTPSPNSLTVEDSRLILNLAQDRFYGTKIKLKPNRYECFFDLRHGTVRPGNLAEVGSTDLSCRQVKLARFENVRFRIPVPEWRRVLAEARRQDRKSAQDFSQRFAKDLKAVIDLEAGQVFKIIRGDNQKDLIGPLPGIVGKNYDIKINYQDAHPPETLGDCKGLGHHFDAVRPVTEETIWAVFRPLEGHETTPGCCECGQIPPLP